MTMDTTLDERRRSREPTTGAAPPITPEAASDARIERMDRVALLYAEITAATRAFLAALAESDLHRDWAEEGFGSCAEWLAWRLGITRNTANEKVRTARALERLPRIAAAMGRGALSFSKVRALTRVATPDNELELLELARAGSAARLERLVRSWRDLDPEDDARRERVLHRSRSFSVFPGEDGMYVVRGRLTPEVGAVLMRAIEAAGDALYRSERDGTGADGSGGSGGSTGSGRDDAAERTERGASDERAERGASEERAGPRHDYDGRADPDDLDRREAARRRADALGLLAERALAAGFGDDAPVSGSRAERYQVMLHVESGMLGKAGKLGESGTLGDTGARAIRGEASAADPRAHEPGAAGPAPATSMPEPIRAPASRILRPHFEDGTSVTAVTARRLACDAARVDIHRAPDGSVLSGGRRTRTVPRALRRALEVRDRGCRFPGCGLRFTDAHHIVHWAEGGETSLRNLVLLCRRHHRAVHEGQVRVCSDLDGKVVFFTPDGRTLFEAPRAPSLEAPAPRAAALGGSGGQRMPAEDALTADQPGATAEGATMAREDRRSAEPAGPTGAESGAMTAHIPLLRRNRARGVRPHPDALRPTWLRDQDIPWRIEAAAWKALDPPDAGESAA